MNSGLTAIALSLESHQPFQKVWREHFARLSLTYFAAASTALCLVLISKEVGLLAVPIILPIIVEFHHTLRASFGRVEDAERHVSEVNRLYMSTVETLAMAIDAKDTVTHSHLRRVQALAGAVAESLRITDTATLNALQAAALLHDTGKLAVPEFILNKPGRLTTDEFDQMKRHVDVGADILSLVPFPYPVVPIIRCHHENWDGSGYPRGVTGIDIPIGARILSVVDCYDALTSDRPYRRRMTDADAMAIVVERRGTMYDPEVVDRFIGLDRSAPLTERPGGEYARVLEQLRPSSRRPPRPVGVEPVTASPVVTPEPVGRPLVSIADEQGLAAGSRMLGAVLRLSTYLVDEIVPGATGAWFTVDPARGRLQAMEPFGPGAHLLGGRTIRIGEQLTGWVAAYRQPIMNSDAALDLGADVDASVPRLGRCLSLPVADGDALAAVLSLYKIEGQSFTAAQARRLQDASPEIARAIRSARDIQAW